MSAVWQRRGVLRAVSILAISAVIAAVISLGTIRDFGSFHASLLTGSPGGAYSILGSQLAERAKGDGGRLDIVVTAGSLENVNRLIADRYRCVEQFAFIQDGTPVSPDSGLELLGRLPEPESLLLLGRSNRLPASFADLRGASIGIGPEGSGTAYLVRLLLGDPDLAGLIFGRRITRSKSRRNSSPGARLILPPTLCGTTLSSFVSLFSNTAWPSSICKTFRGW
jgi:TRAP-type uncharacterized transport system substrate-binding protein